MALTDLHGIENVCRRLEDFALSCDAVMRAIEDGDEEQVRLLVDESRRQRMALGQAQARAENFDLPATPDGVAVLLRMKGLMERVRDSNAAVERWIEMRTTVEVGETLSPEEIVRRRVDHYLPTAWNPETDLAMLVGDDLAEMAAELVRRNVKRILVYLAPDNAAAAAKFPRQARIVRSVNELRAALVDYHAPPPRALAFGAGQDETITEDQKKEVAEAVHTGLRWLNSNVVTAEHLGEAWVLQGIENLPVLARKPSIDRLDDSFRGKPCVIVSAGPSLDKNMHLLKELQGKAVIIAISQVVKALDRAGIKPDLVIASDALDLSVHFEGIDADAIGALVLEATIHPSVFAVPAKRTFCYTGQSFIENWVAEALESTNTTKDMRVSSGGSVSTTAFALALRWGCSPITLVGQDLALTDDRIYVGSGVDGETKLRFSEDGSTFVMEGKRTLEDALGEKISEEERVEWVDGYYGGKVRTSLGYCLFLRWFEAAAKSAREVATLYNATEGGARIEGFEHLPLAEVARRIGDARLDVAAALDAGSLTEGEQTDRCRRLLGKAEQARTMLERCVKQAKHCRKMATSFRKSPGARSKSELAKLTAAEAELAKMLKDVRFISLLRLNQLNAAREEALMAKSVFENLRSVIVLYDIVIEAADRLRPRFEIAVSGLRTPARAVA